MATMYEAVEAISEELTSLIALFFDENEYPDINFNGDGFSKFLKRSLAELLHEANRTDLPDHARLPLLQWVVDCMRYENYKKDVLLPNNDEISTEKPVQSTSIKSTSVTYGKSEAELLRDDRKTQYNQFADELKKSWDDIVISIRKLRW